MYFVAKRNFPKAYFVSLREDPRYKRNRDRVKQDVMDELQPKMEEYLQRKTTAEWCKIFEKTKLLAGPVNSVSQVSLYMLSNI